MIIHIVCQAPSTLVTAPYAPACGDDLLEFLEMTNAHLTSPTEMVTDMLV